MRAKRIPIFLVALLGLALVLTASAAPQGEGEDDYTFFDTLDIEVVNVEVVVTGADGEPVPGLTRDDFELSEDGKRVEITNFYSVDTTPPRTLEPAPAAAAPAATAEARPVSPPAPQDLHLAIFVDGMTLEPINRRRVFDALREFFDYERIRPTSLILASFDGTLEVTTQPSFDKDDLDEHLRKLEGAATRGILREMDRRNLLTDLEKASSSTGPSGGTSFTEPIGASEALRTLNAIQIYADQQYNEARLSTRALASLVEALAGLPGRKALLYVSGGLARHAGEAMFYAWANKFEGFSPYIGVNVTQRARELDTTAELKELIRHANANRVTFYTVGAGRGGRPGGGVGADEGSFDLANMGAPGGGRNWSVGIEAIDNANLGGTLQELAAATGGLSMTNSRNFGKLFSTMNRDFVDYYSLGYIPDRKRDGKNHRLKVRVKGHKVDVRHRENYRELTREEVMSGRTRSAVLLGSRENPLEVAIEFGPTTQQKDSLLVPVMVKVPLGKLVLVPQDEVHVGRIGIFICARDGKGRTSPVQSIDVPIRIPNQAADRPGSGGRLPHDPDDAARAALGRGRRA